MKRTNITNWKSKVIKKYPDAEFFGAESFDDENPNTKNIVSIVAISDKDLVGEFSFISNIKYVKKTRNI